MSTEKSGLRRKKYVSHGDVAAGGYFGQQHAQHLGRPGNAPRRVKHWSSGDMALRWAAAGMTAAQAQFRRVKGYR